MNHKTLLELAKSVRLIDLDPEGLKDNQRLSCSLQYIDGYLIDKVLYHMTAKELIKRSKQIEMTIAVIQLDSFYEDRTIHTCEIDLQTNDIIKASFVKGVVFKCQYEFRTGIESGYGNNE